MRGWSSLFGNRDLFMDKQKKAVIAVNYPRGKTIQVNNRPDEIFEIQDKWQLEWPFTDDLDLYFKMFNDCLDKFVRTDVKLLIICNPPKRFLASLFHKSLDFYRFKYKINVLVLITEGDSALYDLP